MAITKYKHISAQHLTASDRKFVKFFVVRRIKQRPPILRNFELFSTILIFLVRKESLQYRVPIRNSIIFKPLVNRIFLAEKHFHEHLTADIIFDRLSLAANRDVSAAVFYYVFFNFHFHLNDIVFTAPFIQEPHRHSVIYFYFVVYNR